MSLELHHLILYELVPLPIKKPADKKLLTLSQPFHYGGTFRDLESLVRSGFGFYINFSIFAIIIMYK